MPTVLIITTLAEYQTRFWLEVALDLRSRGQDVRIMSFDSRSNEMLEAAGIAYIDATASACRKELADRDPREIVAQFGINDPGLWLAHEKFAFGLRDEEALTRKLAGALLVADRALGDAAHDGEPVLVQELGGFLSVIGSHFAAHRRGTPSWFIEPSFFRGRLLFLEGELAAKHLPPDLTGEVTPAVASYLDDTLAKGGIVIPEKDRHQYTTAFRKVVNLRNFKRLGEKLVDKHLLGKEQEFGHIGSHVATHAKMILASRKLSGHYTKLEDLGRFIYYPLHVPGDMALTLRSPEYLDQAALIEEICRIAPPGVSVAVKEHPAMIGAMGAEPLLRLKARHACFHLIAPSTNNFEVLRQASVVVTVNSKSGAEAGLVGHRVIVLGDAFYRNAPFARPVDGLADLPSALATILGGSDLPPSSERVRSYFAGLWPLTLPGELYFPGKQNVSTFSDSLMTAIAY